MGSIQVHLLYCNSKYWDIPAHDSYKKSSLLMIVKKSKFNPITCYGDTKGKWTYSSTLSVTSALNGVGGLRHTPADLPLGMTRYPMHRRLSGAQNWHESVRKISSSPRSDTRAVQTVANRYIDWANPVHAEDGIRHNMSSAKSSFLMTVQVPT